MVIGIVTQSRHEVLSGGGVVEVRSVVSVIDVIPVVEEVVASPWPVNRASEIDRVTVVVVVVVVLSVAVVRGASVVVVVRTITGSEGQAPHAPVSLSQHSEPQSFKSQQRASRPLSALQHKALPAASLFPVGVPSGRFLQVPLSESHTSHGD